MQVPQGVQTEEALFMRRGGGICPRLGTFLVSENFAIHEKPSLPNIADAILAVARQSMS
jgi:hypothetical protein